mmetsp:Transcript_24849/g.39917  ORF Transcript_24849/g.39917 Transcript_24849/m.39917 type:complete len:195 (+) Transcript_24849:303-887(+)
MNFRNMLDKFSTNSQLNNPSQVAEWARQKGLGGCYSHATPTNNGGGGSIVQVPEIIYHNDTKAAEMHVDWEQRLDQHGVDVCVFATGFNVVSPPAVFLYDGNEIDASRYKPENGRIAENLYGFGLGYPELWTDPEGFSEFRVGFTPSFVQHVRTALHDTNCAKYGRAWREEEGGGETKKPHFAVASSKTTVSYV